MKKTKKAKPAIRSLYQCSLAKVLGDRIKCEMRHRFTSGNEDGTIPITKLKSGSPLEFRICQLCCEYDEIGPPIPKNERGWA